MSILSKILGRKDAEQQQKTGGMEDFMTLIRVYFQAAMAADLGITNLAALPDLRVFKTTLHVPTVNNRLGIGERTRCKKMLKDMYDIDDFFFKEIDSSLRKRCRRLQDVQTYMIQFQNFTQDLMMLLSNLMKFKLRLPSFMQKTLRSLINKTVDDIFNKNDYTDAAVLKTAVGVRQYAAKLGFSQQWTALFAEKVVMLAKKEPRPKDEDIKK
ncbi:hypothetical protein CIK99_09385 [Prevotella sp. P5-92]|uniref:hypothetical protein n=1 Tax=Prevotella sp. P5-92 TaxID=2024222 RepID=UPI000B967CF7|nr:hypothetical protein [Prevotella sp. P5-92]OYP56663.1 hypothetical protein CIK99_09385 [Prevotella sp. P5-92]